MFNKEAENSIEIEIFEKPQEYDNFLKEKNMGSGYGSRAKACLSSDKKITIAIDKAYYLSGGISEEEIEAIIIHEITEILDNSNNAHKNGVIKEYEYIGKKFGLNSLKKYHSNLCNLMGGDNSVRNEALNLFINEACSRQ